MFGTEIRSTGVRGNLCQKRLHERLHLVQHPGEPPTPTALVVARENLLYHTVQSRKGIQECLHDAVEFRRRVARRLTLLLLLLREMVYCHIYLCTVTRNRHLRDA